MTNFQYDLLANYQLTVRGFTYEGVASVRDDFFDGDFGSQANKDVLDGIIEDECLPISAEQILNWELTPAN